MNKCRSIAAAAIVFALSAVVFYLSGLPFERGGDAALWATETMIIAGVLAVLTHSSGGK